MKTMTVYEAKTHLSALLVEVESGEEFVVTRHGRPVARIISVERPIARTPGDWMYPGEYDPGLFAPLTEAEAREAGWPA